MRRFLIVGALVAGLGGSYALAAGLGNSAIPAANNQIPSPPGVPSYQNLGVATTGNFYTYTRGQSYIYMQPSGILAAVTLDTEQDTPTDGQRECFLSTQRISSLTVSPPSGLGQTVNSSPTSATAFQSYCWQWNQNLAQWNASP